MFFLRYKYFLAFVVLVMPDGERKNCEFATRTNRSFLNQVYTKSELLRQRPELPEGTIVIFTNIIRLSKLEFNEWKYTLCLNE